MGLDPFIVLGATTFGVATLGWLCGPTLGTAAFRMWAGRNGWNSGIAEVCMTKEWRGFEVGMLMGWVEGEVFLREDQAI